MFLKARVLELEAKKPIVILNKHDARELDVKPLDRVSLALRKKKIVAIVNVTERFVEPGFIGLYGVVVEELKAKKRDNINVSPTPIPESLVYIRHKIAGRVLKPQQIRQIIIDVVNNKLSEIEITAFVTALHNHGMVMQETAALSTSMAQTGKMLLLGKGKRDIFDKHSIGGVCGDKTSMLLVPAIAAAGLTIPKTSSRAITSPAGTADRFECLAPVDLNMDEMRGVVRKTNGCLVWGGSVELAPADDIFIHVEYPLSIDPMLLPSVMSKKMAVKAKYLVIDIPTGRGAKIKTIGEANELANKFIELGKLVGINVSCLSTYGEQPFGYGVGPALEAREALQILKTGRGPHDVIDKVVNVAATLMSFRGAKNPQKRIADLIRTGKAYKKLKEIIETQGGKPDVKPEDIPVGEHCVKVKSASKGRVWWVSNPTTIQVAREAGAPANSGAGLHFHKKIGDIVKKGDVLFEVFSEKPHKLNRALKLLETSDIMGVGEKFNMVMAKIPEEEHEKRFVFER